MMNLYKKLIEYKQSEYYGFHMPGHKRRNLMTNPPGEGGLPFEIDITEIEGFDDLHHAKGILKEAQERAARLYNGDETYFLINGSTSGLISAILGCTRKGDHILLARNCHKSVYNAVYMNELRPTYIYPKFYKDTELSAPIKAADVRQALANQRAIKAVVITSPTYDGVVSDVKAIAEVAHEYEIPLIVDEAHGAHFGFHEYFPDNANVLGADIVIHSMHKTLPSLTQTALLHINGDLVNRRKVREYLHMLQTSSPSYVLMASIDACVDLVERRGKELFEEYATLLRDTRQKLEHMKCLQLWRTDNFDPSKLVISVKNTQLGSRKLYKLLLEKYQLQMEMRAGSYVLAMTSVADSKEGMNRLVHALLEIDEQLSQEKQIKAHDSVQTLFLDPLYMEPLYLEQRFTSAEAEKQRDRLLHIAVGQDERTQIRCLPWNESIGAISLEYGYVYPPGIPLVVPGEVMSKELVDMLNQYKKIGFTIEGFEKDGQVEVLIDG